MTVDSFNNAGIVQQFYGNVSGRIFFFLAKICGLEDFEVQGGGVRLVTFSIENVHFSPLHRCTQTELHIPVGSLIFGWWNNGKSEGKVETT